MLLMHPDALTHNCSPLTLHWDLDQVPQSYYADSESTVEFDRRKTVGDFEIFVVPRSTQVYLTVPGQ